MRDSKGPHCDAQCEHWRANRSAQSLYCAALRAGEVDGAIERLRPTQRIENGIMTDTPAALRSGKSHRDENFPVASHLIHPRHRGAILAFYEFVRIADDIADHPALDERAKLDHLDR